MSWNHSVRNQIRKNISVEHYNRSHDCGKRYRVPENETKDVAFGTHLIRGRRGDADGLRVNHLPHNAAGAVRRAHENRAQVQLFSGDALQSSEQRIRRCIATSQRHPEPADIRAEKGKEPSGSRERQT